MMEDLPTNPGGEKTPFPLKDVDRFVLSQTDEEFVPHTWEESREIVETNNLSAFSRFPSQQARYIVWSHDTKARYGAIQNYICQQRLHWEPQASPHPLASNGHEAGGHARDLASTPPSSQRSTFAVTSPQPFASTDDYKILRNDWPYGVTPDIDHVVVWLKTPFEVNADGGLVPESRALIDSFVNRVFVQRLEREGRGEKGHEPGDRVLWFKNWTAIQSVGALEHFHVLVRGVGDDILWEWTGEGKRGG